MKYFFYLIAIVVLLALDVGFFPFFKFFGVVPNLLLVFVAVTALDRENYDCFFIAIISGLFLDFYSTAFFGSFCLAMLCIAAVIKLIASNFLVSEISWKQAIFLLIGATVLNLLVIWLVNFLAFRLGWLPNALNFGVLKFRIIPEITYNILLLLPVYKLTELIKHFLKTLKTRRHIA